MVFTRWHLPTKQYVFPGVFASAGVDVVAGMATAANAEAIEAMHTRRTRSAQVILLNAIAQLRVCFSLSDGENGVAELSVP
jgi:hypothetical protein